MTMKLTQLTTYWDADDAHTVITFLDELRDILWATYGEDIIDMLQAASNNNLGDSSPIDPDLDDEITF